MEVQKQKLLRRVNAQPENHEKALTAFKDSYEGLSIGKYSNEVLENVINNGLADIEKRFKAIASDQLNKSGVTSPLLKANLLKGCDEVLQQFSESIEGLVKSAEAVNKKIAFDRITSKQMQVAFMGIWGCCISFQNENVKRLTCGIGGGFTTKCGKSFDVGYSKIEILPTEIDWHVYVKVPREGTEGSICAFNEPQANTDKHFFIHWQSGSFKDIKIPA